MATGAAVRYSRCLDIIFRHEGGYVDHPRDPGGATNMGITHRTLANHRGRPVTKADVRALTRAEAAEIYRKNYWNVVRGGDMPAGIDLVVFDPAVNSGPRRGIQWLQRALRDATGQQIAVDGAVGSQTVEAAHKAAQIRHTVVVIKSACAVRMGFLRSLGTFSTFGRGWTRRVAEVEAQSVAWAAADMGESVRNVLVASEQEADREARNARTTGQTAGVAAPTGAVTADQMTDMPMWGVAGLLVFGAIIVVLAVGRVKQQREREAAYRRQAVAEGR